MVTSLFLGNLGAGEVIVFFLFGIPFLIFLYRLFWKIIDRIFPPRKE